MMMSELTYSTMLDLLKASFDLNAEADNFAYNLSSMYYGKMSDIVHHAYAHAFPVDFADALSDEMLKLQARPIRKALNEYGIKYDNLVELFDANVAMMTNYRQQVINAIEIAEINNDQSIKIFLEDFLVNTVDLFVAQAQEWATCARQYDAIQLNTHFDELTTFIKVEA